MSTEFKTQLKRIYKTEMYVRLFSSLSEFILITSFFTQDNDKMFSSKSILAIVSVATVLSGVNALTGRG